MFCSNCKNQLIEGAKFCMSCGAPVVVKAFCMGCGTELAPEAKFCPSCGQSRYAAPPKTEVEVFDDEYEEYDDDTEEYDEEVDESSDESNSLYALGDEHYDRKDFAKAIEFYEKASNIARAGNPSALFFRLGYAFSEVGKWEQSIGWYEKFINEFPDNPDVKFAYNNLGYAYGKIGNTDKQVENFKEAARLGNEGSQQWLSSKSLRGYTENDFIIKTMRSEGIDPENAEDRVWGAYNRRFIFKEGKCMRCGGKLTLLRKCKSCGASAFEGTM